MPDPRLAAPPRTVNGVLQDRAIRHAIFVRRFATGEVNRITAFLNRDLYPDILARIERGFRGFEGTDFARLGAVRRQQRFLRMQEDVAAIIRQGMTTSRQRLADGMVEFAKSEATWSAEIMRQSVPVALDFKAPGAQSLRSIVLARPFQGRLLREWGQDLEASLRGKVRTQIQIGMAEGEGIDQIVRRIRGTRAARFTDGVIARSRREVAAVVRTAVNHTHNHAREATYLANDEVVKGVQWLSTLDLRTTPICQDLDGQVFDVGKGPRPPAHFACRSTTTPVLRSFDELGLGDRFKDVPRGMRDAMNGRVPAATTYPQWLRQQPAAVQDMVLGKGKGQLFRRGRVKFDRFVDDKGRAATLRELEALESRQ